MKVHELLAEPSRWTKGDLAKTKDGLSIDFNNPEAASWCLMGAIRKVYDKLKGYDEYEEVREKVYDKLESVGICSMVIYNDNATHEQVLALARELDI